MTGHVFISHVSEDSAAADRLQAALEAAGIQVWRASADLAPGDDWRSGVREAISDHAAVFLACFSRTGLARERSYQREELSLAIEQQRLRSREVRWLIPVRFDDCKIPDWDIGAGRTLRSLQYADLFGDRRDAETSRLAASIARTVEPVSATAGRQSARGRGSGLVGSPRRAAIIAVTIALGTGVITSAILAAHGQDSGSGFLTVQGRPWTTTAVGRVRQILAAGNPVRYEFEVDNLTGEPINAGIRFDVYWGTIDEPQVNIFNILFRTTVPTGLSIVSSRLTHIPASALPGMYTEQADISNLDNPGDHTGQYGSIDVTGQKLLPIPFLALPATLRPSAAYDGPACVAMILGSHSGTDRPTIRGVRAFIAASDLRRAPAAGEALEYALAHFGVAEATISQISLSEPGLPQAQVTEMAIAVRQGSPVIAFVDGVDLGTANNSYTGRWIVVVGFGFSAAHGADVLINDPDASPGLGKYAGQRRPVGIGTFERAVSDAANLPAAQQEPDHIAGIVVAGLSGPGPCRTGRRCCSPGPAPVAGTLTGTATWLTVTAHGELASPPDGDPSDHPPAPAKPTHRGTCVVGPVIGAAARLDTTSANAAAAICARTGVSVADAHLGAVAQSASATQISVITSDPRDMRQVAGDADIIIVAI